jgi:hydroxyethylthiazole kinase-like uncharacterized protein yjeF
MQPLVSPQEMAKADEAAISAGTPAEILMDRAGRAVARAAIDVAGGRYGKSALVVCGKGNNGGDGFVAARRLSREGLKVSCVLVGETSDVKGAAAHHLAELRRAGISVATFDPTRPARRYDVVIDALLGTGSSGAPRAGAAAAIRLMNESGPIVAADIPSGVDGLTGGVPGESVSAAVTVAIERQKLGSALAPGFDRAGRVEVAPVGIPVTGENAFLLSPADVGRVIPVRGAMSHKGSTGSVALVAGSKDMSGAAVLCARAADRAGAGYVRVGTVTAARAVVAERLPEALVTDLGDDWDGSSWSSFRHEAERSDALLIGPGLGTGSAAEGLVDVALAETDHPIVLDADGLNAIAGRDEALKARRSPTVLTPHVGEMARLLDIENAEVLADTLGTARRAAETFGCIVLLKGARTVVARPDGRAVVNPIGSPALATAGSGDVLGGVIAAFLAAGLEAFDAAWAGAAVHGRAGELAAEGRGTTGVVAWDVAEALPLALRTLRAP